MKTLDRTGVLIEDKLQVQLKMLEDEIRRKEAQIADLEKRGRQNEEYIQWIHSGRGWKALLKYYKLRDSLLPYGSRSRQFVKGLANLRLRAVPKESLLKSFCPNFEEFEHSLSKGKQKIGIVYRGGMGDTLLLYWLGNALRRRFPEALIFLIPSERNVNELKHMTCFLTNTAVIHLNESCWDNVINFIHKEKFFDLFFDCRYTCKVTSNNEKFSDFSAPLETAFNRYDVNFKEFPKGNYLHKKHGKSLLDLVQDTSGINLQGQDITYPLSPEDLVLVDRLGDVPYITLFTGIDQHYQMQTKGQRTTKQWPHSYWQELVNKIISQGINVIQMGSPLDKPLAGVINLTGKTTLGQAAALIKHSLLNVANEGGSVWLAKAVGTKSVVIFGPTDPNFFGQPENINITANLPCSPCWWSKLDWMQICPAGHKTAKCMDMITPETVFAEVRKMLEELYTAHN